MPHVPALDRSGMQTALSFGFAGPASFPLIVASPNRMRARLAAYAGVSLIMQRIVWHAVAENVVPYFLL